MKKLSILLLMLFMFNTKLYANTVDFDKKGSIEITLLEKQENTKIDGAEITIYKVANATEENYNLAFEYVNELSNCNVSLKELDTDNISEEINKCDKCCNKKTYRSVEEKKLLNNRLNRIEGQIRGVKKMLDEDVYCNDVLIQLSAIENSLKSLSNQILENHLYTCIANDMENGKIDTIDEIISLFKRFNK